MKAVLFTFALLTTAPAWAGAWGPSPPPPHPHHHGAPAPLIGAGIPAIIAVGGFLAASKLFKRKD